MLKSGCTGPAGGQGPWRGLVRMRGAKKPAWSSGAFKGLLVGSQSP